MLLHQIRTNYRDLSPTGRMEAIHSYRAKRLAELKTPVLAKPKAAKATKANGNSKSSTPRLSAQEKALLKKLGVSLKALKNAE